ncbi:unnamed protein product [Effrenium voratum]|nr:unnamed protein product [Effrenium voratum]
MSTSASRRFRRKRAAQRAAAKDPSRLAQGPVAVGRVWNPMEALNSHRLQELVLGKPEELAEAIEALKGHVWELSCHPTGCRLVQLAFERGNPRAGGELVAELQGHVLEAVCSPHANFVLQKAIKHLTWAACAFMSAELEGQAASLACHQYGCRIFCRLLEFYYAQEATQRLMDEVLQDAGSLCCHPFGHHVAHSVMEHGSQKHRDMLAMGICCNPIGFAKNPSASYLVENALFVCSPCYQEALLRKLTRSLADLVTSHCGCFVVRAVLEHPKSNQEEILEQLQGAELRKLNLMDLGLNRRRMNSGMDQ